MASVWTVVIKSDMEEGVTDDRCADFLSIFTTYHEAEKEDGE